MNTVAALEQRLQDLAAVLAGTPDALALLGLGSAGLETSRMDDWSDLDFFVVVEPGHKQPWIDQPEWLDRVHPVGYRFRNSPDGFKLLFADGIFAEMAVFEPDELAHIPFAEGRVIWHRDGFDPALLQPRSQAGHKWKPDNPDYLVGELLTCLYVGLCRWHRGEKLSAWRFIQGYCLDRFLELADFWELPQPALDDAYSRDRRFEQRYPTAAVWLDKLLAGYSAVPQSVQAFLSWLEGKTTVDPVLRAEIEKMLPPANL